MNIPTTLKKFSTAARETLFSRKAVRGAVAAVVLAGAATALSGCGYGYGYGRGGYRPAPYWGGHHHHHHHRN